MSTLRQKAGALLYDGPRFLRAILGGRGAWTRYRNRNERIAIDANTGGVRCEWEFGSDLHVCNVFPSAARMLFRRAVEEWPIAFDGVVSSGDTPRVAFLIGHRGESRRPHLLATLASIGGQRDVGVECIVVEQSETPTLPPHLPTWVRYIHTPITSDAQPYNRSWTFNVGARLARAPLLVLHDNDILVPADYARALAALHAEGWEMINAKRFLFYLDQAGTEHVVRSRAFPPDLAPNPITQNLLGGSFAADRAAYFAIGGFDETYAGWGGEDNEFFRRASTRRCWNFGFLPMVHLWHAPQPEKQRRDAEGPRRFRRDAEIPVEERIARVRAQSGGRPERAYAEPRD